MAEIDLSGLESLIKIGNVQGSSNGIGSTGNGGGAGDSIGGGTSFGS